MSDRKISSTSPWYGRTRSTAAQPVAPSTSAVGQHAGAPAANLRVAPVIPSALHLPATQAGQHSGLQAGAAGKRKREVELVVESDGKVARNAGSRLLAPTVQHPAPPGTSSSSSSSSSTTPTPPDGAQLPDPQVDAVRSLSARRPAPGEFTRITPWDLEAVEMIGLHHATTDRLRQALNDLERAIQTSALPRAAGTEWRTTFDAFLAQEAASGRAGWATCRAAFVLHLRCGGTAALLEEFVRSVARAGDLPGLDGGTFADADRMLRLLVGMGMHEQAGRASLVRAALAAHPQAPQDPAVRTRLLVHLLETTRALTARVGPSTPQQVASELDQLLEAPGADARQWFTPEERELLYVRFMDGIGVGRDTGTARHVLSQLLRDGAATRPEVMEAGVAFALVLRRSPQFTQADSRVPIARAVVEARGLPAHEGVFLLRAILAPGMPASVSSLAASLWNLGRSLPPASCAAWWALVLHMQQLGDEDAMLVLGLVDRIRLATAQDGVSELRAAILACAYAMARDVRAMSRQDRLLCEREFAPALMDPAATHTPAQRHAALGVRMAHRPSCVLDEPWLEHAERVRLLSHAYQIEGVLDRNTARAELGVMLDAPGLALQERMELLSCLFQHGGHFLGRDAVRAVRCALMPQLVKAMHHRHDHKAGVAWEQTADQFELLTPLLALHRGLLDNEGLGWLRQPHATRPQGPMDVRALQSLRDFLREEIDAVRSSVLPEAVRTQWESSLGTELAFVLAELPPPIPAAIQVSRSLPSMEAIESLD